MGYSVIINGARRCITCGDSKPVAEFYCYPYVTKQGKSSTRTDSRCLECNRSRRRRRYAQNKPRENCWSRDYHAKNNEAVSRRVTQYRQADPERCRLQKRIAQQKRKARAGISAAENRELIERVLAEAMIGDKYLDAYSGELIDNPQIDHIVPLKNGGAHTYDNLCVTSAFNNGSKHCTPMLIWLATR
jgi:5-methylcytosine-specific restriction endonuclease McrA